MKALLVGVAVCDHRRRRDVPFGAHPLAAVDLDPTTTRQPVLYWSSEARPLRGAGRRRRSPDASVFVQRRGWSRASWLGRRIAVSSDLGDTHKACVQYLVLHPDGTTWKRYRRASVEADSGLHRGVALPSALPRGRSTDYNGHAHREPLSLSQPANDSARTKSSPLSVPAAWGRSTKPATPG
jgi:hypothetical protein